MLLDASGNPIPLTPLPPQAAPAVQEEAPTINLSPLAQYANPALAQQLRGLADLVEKGTVFALAVVGLGLDEKSPKAITCIHEHPGHRAQMIAELEIVKSLVARALIDMRYFPKPTFANGEPVPDRGA
jgi:hypothetical protein